MFSLNRNTYEVYYKLYLGITEIVDEYGNATGSFTPKYSELKSMRLSVSPNKGRSESEMFGTVEEYDRTMTTADMTCPIDEESILWLDGHDPSGPHNYIVQRRAPWKNSVAFAIKRVDVRG